ncbi:FAD-binding oxidoreductase [Bradyrhizobium sp.]|uniref:FAD-binding oxidoreductase n=1 Tax=Bradyrhizobium sp. TaxID=376 RepID=UPI002E0695D0|nr:FAD-binding oxidoreductase [Bradyrhizobium sp.]
MLDDASRLNATPINRQAILTSSEDGRLLRELRATLGEAATEGRPIAVGGARHSMGGQSLPRNGIAASFAAAAVEPDTARGIYRVSAGARWRDLIRVLDPIGFSPAVTQSNHDFSIGGTLSVNAHGWPVPFAPFGGTVQRFRIMLADGSVLTCSKSENPELFRLAVGGYGLFGIVIDAELAMVENSLLTPGSELMKAEAFAPRFVARANDPSLRMLYGRLSVARVGFLQAALLVGYRPAPQQPERLPPPKKSSTYTLVSRGVFRAQTGSERGKQARWIAETRLMPRLGQAAVTRNTLLDMPVVALEDRDSTRTDILHEYFVAPDRFNDFLAACREVIPAHRQDLLNVTLRYVDADSSSVLAYAPQPRIAAVMLFVQKRTAEADADMRAMTVKLIDRVAALGGSYYLPYRLHATPEQMRAAYPRLDEFIAAKRRYDPQLRFRNALWDTYLA